MSAGQRLDRVEPLVSQNLAVADRHTAQLQQLVGSAIQQSENMEFVLTELSEMKGDIVQMRGELVEVKENQQVIVQVEEKQQGTDSKLDRILDLLGESGQ